MRKVISLIKLDNEKRNKSTVNLIIQNGFRRWATFGGENIPEILFLSIWNNSIFSTATSALCIFGCVCNSLNIDLL